MTIKPSLVFCATAISCCALSNFALAQDSTKQVTLTTEQIELNNKAVKALNSKDADAAIDYMRAALREEGQRANVLYLTLGRAYQIKGQCDDAKKNFKLAETTASVTGVPKDFVNKKLTNYRKDMAPLCPGKLSITCKDKRVKLTLTSSATKTLIQPNNVAPRCGDVLTLKKGPYDLVAMAKDKAQTVQVTIRGDQTSTADVTITLPKQKVIVEKDVVPTAAIVVGISTLVVSGGLWGYHFYARNEGENAYKAYAESTTESAAETNKAEVDDWAQKARYSNRAAWGLAAAGTIATLAIVFWPEGEQPTASENDASTSTWTPLIAPGTDGLWLGGELRW